MRSYIVKEKLQRFARFLVKQARQTSCYLLFKDKLPKISD